MKLFKWMLFALFLACSCVQAEEREPNDLLAFIQSRALPLNDAADLDRLIHMAGERRLVLLGEASHGTHEYYAWRDSISRRLIAEHGFRFIAVEGDWASLYELNRYVKHMPGAAGSAQEVLMGLDRWPLWMWGNEEVLALAEWMREYNAGRPPGERAGFYGKDVYDEWRSLSRVKEILAHHDRELYQQVSAHYTCFEAYGGDSWQYAQAVARGAGDCVLPLSRVVDLLRDERHRLDQLEDHEYFDLLQNALVLKHAEKFYRLSLTRQDASSWNSRVNYMHMTVNRLLDMYGPESQGIVWAHNTHIGDARFTEMQQRRQENIGQLARVDLGPDNVFLVGFSTYKGEVKAGASWGDRRQKMEVPEAPANSIEGYFERTGEESFYLLFDDTDRTHEAFMQPMGNRAIGVVYDPRNDPRQYVQTIVPLRYDALLFFRETRALTPLHP